eukprot:9862720-Alexandrium_andersonii.AAC.1
MLRPRLLGVHLDRVLQRCAEGHPLLEHCLQPVAPCGVELDQQSELVVRARCRGPTAGPDDGQ